MCDFDEDTTGRVAGKRLDWIATSLLTAALFVAVTAFPAALIAATCARVDQTEVTPKFPREAVLGSPYNFTGEVRVSSPLPATHQERGI